MIVWRVVGLLACDSSGFLRLPACIELLQQRQQQQAPDPALFSALSY